MSNDANAPLEPPNLPFSSRNSSFRSLSPKNENPFNSNSDTKSIAPSLSVNYLPSKFSGTLLTGGPKRRKNWKGAADDVMPKRGGGREAFKSNESRMPGDGDDDYDGVEFNTREGGRTKPKLRWNRFKWTLFVANIIFTGYTLTGLIACLLIWFNVWTHADIIRVGNRTELIISTLAASLGVFTSLLGWSGILLNNRAFLATYSFLLWIVFAFLVTPGYITYKKRTFNLEGKINAQWSRDLGLEGRLRVQNQLGCCGYFNPFVEATISQTCYARSLLPGCKAPYVAFERMALERWYTVVFSLVPAQIAIMVVGLLCSNHVTYRFGKGMMPKAYRLNMNSMAVIMDNYANQLAEQYGNDVASEILARSRSNLQLDAMPTVPYSSSLSASSTYNGAKYDSIGGKS
ncbi:hypothetical protein CERSUDRAFT_60750 [Gelatoporia subvermispora B]|uniref:Tetraspanin Tsp2 family n=1 Tax=Ceriporiopsis subvermispora (strain B) TaxID=914234 RepID=M2QWI7_CERS8|nr:hypothetical protein CERSUDRAFT_60750 [Gelatoporia subvermispora B]